jgi:glycosyltransferase involved in cell wall biosynthesis
MSKKLVSVVIPIYNEISMLEEIYNRINDVFEKLSSYTYEIVFFDDGSTDGTRKAVEELCRKHNEVKAVFYSRNFGYMKNTFYCMQQAKGDCAVIVHADLQNPPELIPEFLEKWEKGAQVVLGVKNKSKENKFVYFLRTVFYFLMIKVFGVNLIPHATEFELFDRSFIDILRRIKVNTPFLRGIVMEYACVIDYVYYTQDARKKGKSKFNLNKYYDFAICGITQYSVCLPRRIILCCLIALALIFAEFCFVVLPNVGNSDLLSILNSVILRGILAAVCILIIVVCILFEYIISMKNNSTEKPMIIEEKRIDY